MTEVRKTDYDYIEEVRLSNEAARRVMDKPPVPEELRRHGGLLVRGSEEVDLDVGSAEGGQA